MAIGLSANSTFANTAQSPMDVLLAKALADIKIAEDVLATVQANPISLAIYNSSKVAYADGKSQIEAQLEADVSSFFDAQTTVGNATEMFNNAEMDVANLKAYASGTARKNFRDSFNILPTISQISEEGKTDSYPSRCSG
jgi:hypothetical protein